MKKNRLKFSVELAGMLILGVSMFAMHHYYAASGVVFAAIFISSTLDRVRNKLERHVFSRNKSGDYMKLRVKPSNNKTVAQMTSRGSFAQISRQWKSLTPMMHHLWNQYGEVNPVSNKLGVAMTLSGYNWFMKVNIPLHYMGQEIKLVPCPDTSLYPPRIKGECKAEYEENTKELKSLKIKYTDTDTSPDVVFEVFTSQKVSTGKTSYKSMSYKYSMIIPRTAYPEGELDLAPAVAKTAGLWKSTDLDRLIYFKVRQVNLVTGEYGVWDVMSYRTSGMKGWNNQMVY